MNGFFRGARFGGLLILVCLATARDAKGQATISNGSFETGDFTDWIATDNFGTGLAFEPVSVLSAGSGTSPGLLSGVFLSLDPDFSGVANEVIPSDGAFAASHGFDGDPGTISIAQDIGVIFGTQILTFDHRAGWDLINFNAGGAEDRSFDDCLNLQEAVRRSQRFQS